MKHAFTLLLSLAFAGGLITPTQAQTTSLPVRAPSRPSTQTVKQSTTQKQAPSLNATTAATIRYVKAGASGMGTSWSNASGDLQAMINASASGDQVWIAGGVYKPSTTGLANARTAAFSLKNGVSVLGGFTGAAGTEGNVSTRTAIPSSTTLSGDIGNTGDANDNTYHVIFNYDNALTNSAVLDGVAITGGNANGSGDSAFGGGIYNNVSAPSILNCQFYQNSSVNGGGGVLIAYSQLDSPSQDGVRIINCSFQNNTGYISGVYNQDATKTVITNCFFGQNSSIGSGVFGTRSSLNYATSATLTNCTFSGNTPSAITLLTAPNSTTVNLINCLLWNNGGQAAIDVQAGSTLTASYCLIEAGETNYTNGGNNQTLTTSPFANATGPQLSQCAPAVDTGNDAANTTTTDVLGSARKVRTIDIGAAEYQGAPYVAPTLVTQSQTATTVCAGNSVTFAFDIITGADGVTAGSLYRDNTYVADAAVSVGPNRILGFRRSFPISQSGTYQIVVVSTCSSLTTTFAPITVNPLPTSFSVTGGGAYCTGNAGNVVGLSGSQTGVNYQLLRGGTATGTPVTGTGTPISFGPQSTTGTYTVQATNTSTTCTQTMSGSAVVSVNALPTVTITPAATTICAGQSTNLTASGADTYRWITTQTTASISVSVAGPYSVTGTTTTTGCSSTATANVTVTPLPNAGFTGLPASVCVDAAPNSLSPTTSGGTFSGPGISGNTFSPATAGAGGPYSVTYTVSNMGCPNSSVQQVTVNPLPVAPMIATQSGHSYPGGVSSLTIAQNVGDVILTTSGCAGGTITWAGGMATTLAVSTMNTGVQTFTATCTSNSTGCTSPVATATVTVVPTALRVLHREATNNDLFTTAIKPYLILDNTGNQAILYQQITVRYWLTVENPAPVTNLPVYYADLGTSFVHPAFVPISPTRTGATGYVEYRFDAAAGSLAPRSNSGRIENGISKQDYSPFNQADDYSYMLNRDYTPNQRITAYINGQIVWGQEPAVPGTTPPSPLQVTASATSPVIPTTANTTLIATPQGGSGSYTYAFSGPGTITPNGNTAVAANLPAGVQTFTITVTDTSTPTAQTATTTVSLTVTAPPVPPLTLTLTASPTSLLTTGTTTLTATVSGGTPAYQYSFRGPGTITPSGNTASVSGLMVGVQTFTVVVSDATTPTALTLSATLSVTVINTPPTPATNPSQTATVGQGFTYTVAAFADLETPGSLTYTARLSPANGLSFNPATRVIMGTPTLTGETSVTITATDPGGLSASTVFTIAVNPTPVVAGPATLRVLHRDASNGQLVTNAIYPYLILENTGTTAIPYSQLTVRYWLTVENPAPVTNLVVYSAEVGAGNVRMQYVASPRQGATGYVEYSFTSGAGSLGALSNSGVIANAISKQDYSSFNQADDYSYVRNGDFAPNTHITAYLNGSLVYGTEPPVGVRLGAEGADAPLTVQVLGNPVVGSAVAVLVTGAEGQPLTLHLTDLSGRSVTTRQIERAGATESQRLDVGNPSAGMLLLRVSTPTQSQTVKVLRQ